jgi:hypothetical protein
MKGFKIHNSMLKRGLYLGIAPEAGAVEDSSTLLNLDHDLDILPESGRHRPRTPHHEWPCTHRRPLLSEVGLGFT